MKKIPVFINNRNRLTTLKNLIDWLRSDKVEIVVLDNDSRYYPLLEYYKTIDCEVIKLNRNLGHKALYEWKGYQNYSSEYFIYTDSDLMPNQNCPKDLVEYLIFSKKKYSNFTKVGASLEIKDIPDFYFFKKDVLAWESNFWKNEFEDFYIADIDTTFAAYEQSKVTRCGHTTFNCLRSKRPYTMRHEPWYLDLKKLNEEELYYIISANSFVDEKKKIKTGYWTQLHKSLQKKFFL